MKNIYFFLLILIIKKSIQECSPSKASKISYKLMLSDFSNLKELNFSSCQSPIRARTLTLKPSKRIILDNTLNLTGLVINPLLEIFSIELNNFKGFELNTASVFERLKINSKWQNVFIKIDNSDFDFYSENRSANKKCDVSLLNVSFWRSFLSDFYLTSLHNDITYSEKTCPIIFHNAFINVLNIEDLASSLIKYNKLEFLPLELKNLNSSVFQLNINIYHYDINRKFLNEDVFKELKTLDINGAINLIESDLFKAFSNLGMIRIKTEHLRNIFVRNNKWLDSLNTHVFVDLRNNPPLSQLWKSVLLLVFYQVLSGVSVYKYPDEDLCYFRNFPHERLVIPVLKPERASSCSCTELFLTFDTIRASKYIDHYLRHNIGSYYYSGIQYYADEVYQNVSKCKNASTLAHLRKCNLEEKFSNCRIKTIQPLSRESYFYLIDLRIVSKGFFISNLYSNLFTSTVCVFLNGLTIFTLMSKKITKEFIKTYKYLILHTCFNTVYLFITFMRLICNKDLFECMIENTIYMQYFKLIAVKFLGNTIKTASNISHVAFTLSRYVVMTKSNILILKWFSELSVKKFFLITFIFSSAVNIYTCFQYALEETYQPNNELVEFHFNYSNYYEHKDPYDYKQDFYSSDHLFLNIFQYIRIIFSDTIYIVMSFVIDVLLFFFVRTQMRNKEKLIFGLSLSAGGQELQKRQMNTRRQARASINRITSIIILNSLNFLVFRFPASLLTFYGFIYFYDKTERRYEPSILGFAVCHGFRVCESLNELFHFLYLLSFIVQFFILFKLDKNFIQNYQEMKNSIKNILRKKEQGLTKS